MAHKRKDALVAAPQWWRHLRPFEKRASPKRNVARPAASFGKLHENESHATENQGAQSVRVRFVQTVEARLGRQENRARHPARATRPATTCGNQPVTPAVRAAVHIFARGKMICAFGCRTKSVIVSHAAAQENIRRRLATVFGN